MVLDRKTVNTTRELMSRLRKALKMELQADRTEIQKQTGLGQKPSTSLEYVTKLTQRPITLHDVCNSDD